MTTSTGAGGGRAAPVVDEHPVWSHNGSVPNVQIKNVPEATHSVLRRRAAAAHQSLQEYLLSWLVQETSRPTVDEVLTQAGGRGGGSLTLADAAAAVRADRDRR